MSMPGCLCSSLSHARIIGNSCTEAARLLAALRCLLLRLCMVSPAFEVEMTVYTVEQAKVNRSEATCSRKGLAAVKKGKARGANVTSNVSQKREEQTRLSSKGREYPVVFPPHDPLTGGSRTPADRDGR